MIVDTSAIVAVIKREPRWQSVENTLTTAASTTMSAATYVELGIVIDRKMDPTASRQLDRLLAGWRVQIAPLTPHQARIARAAYRDFGRGSGHPARLNFGDCFSYALAADTGEPLLFVGDDFTHTDVLAAMA